MRGEKMRHGQRGRFAGVEVRGARARPVRAAGAREGGGCGAKQRLARAEVRGEGSSSSERVGVGVGRPCREMAKSSFYSCDNEL